MIFVFGSNEAGIHGAGAAKTAYEEYDALYGYGIGHCGNSYAIPTKDRHLKSLPIEEIAKYVDDFIVYAKGHPELAFKVTQIGCGYAGFSAKEMAPLFRNAPHNCQFDLVWKPYLGPTKIYWGTF